MKTIHGTQELATSADLPYLTRLRGGTYSHTVDLLHFSDGTAALTDLIRLNPNVEGYSLDRDGHSPARLARYEDSGFAAVRNPRARQSELQISRIITGSYPLISVGRLSDVLRAHGYPLGGANLREHEAIAATQAAIWHYSNGSRLDTRAAASWLDVFQSGVQIIPSGDGLACVPMRFEEPIELGCYEIEVRGNIRGFATWLEKSIDGRSWRRVSTSTIDVSGGSLSTGGSVRRRKNLGYGATVTSMHGSGRAEGYRHYRVVLSTPDLPEFSDVSREVAITGLRVQPSASAEARNSDRVIFLYDYLLRLAQGTIHADPHLAEVVATQSGRPASGRLGPYMVTGAAGRVRVGVQGSSVRVCDADGRALTNELWTHQQFHIVATGLAVGTSALCLTVENQPVTSVVALTGTDAASSTEEYTPVVSGQLRGTRSEMLIHTIDWDTPSPSIENERQLIRHA